MKGPFHGFVDHHDTVFHREANIEIDGFTFPVEIDLTEGGQLNLSTERIDPSGLKGGLYSEVVGATDQGERIVINDLYCFTDSMLSFKAQSVEIGSHEERTVEGEEVNIHADVLGFQYKSTPRFSDPDDSLTLLSRDNWRAGSGNNVDWHLELRPFRDYTTRIRSIQNHHNLVRTVQFDLSISGLYGGLDRIADVADKIYNEVMWISAFIQGTLPATSKLEIKNGMSGGSGLEYVRLKSLHNNAGGNCKPDHRLFFTSEEIPVFLDRAFDNYQKKKDWLELNRVLGFYVDSLDPNRPIDVKFTNLCIAMEMLADRLLPDQGYTKDQIEGMIHNLGIESADLIPNEGSLNSGYDDEIYAAMETLANHLFPDQEYTEDQINGLIHYFEVEYLDIIPDGGSLKSEFGPELSDLDDITPEYFWYRSRNHVIHGGSSVTTQEISRDHSSLRTLLRRILREILLDGETDSLHGMTEFEPNDIVNFS